MRAFALFGLLMTGACGLGVGGLRDDLFDAGGTDDGTAPTDEASGTPQDATADRSEAAATTGSDGGGDAGPSSDAGGADVITSRDEGGSDADAGADADADAAVRIDSGDAAGPADSGNADVNAADATEDGPTDAGAPVEAGPLCTNGIPIGWRLAVYDLGSNVCPSNFAGHDVSGPPVVGAGACSCNCSVTQDGSCTQGTLTAYGNYTGAVMCTQFLFSTAISGPGCIASGGPLVQAAVHGQATPLAPQGGSCSSTSQTDATQVTTPAAHYCDVPAASADTVCSGTAPAGFAACIETSGDTAVCPVGTPFVTTRYVVEDAVSLGCTACSCGVTTTCSGAMLSAYGDAFCQNQAVASIPVDGTCHDTGAPAPPFPPEYTAAIRYTATASTTCTAGASSASTQLTNPRTICCR